MKKIIFLTALMLLTVIAFGQSKVIPADVVLSNDADMWKYFGACYAMKPVPGKQGDFFPAMVLPVNKGLVVGVSAEKPNTYGHAAGNKTDYVFFPWSEVNLDPLKSLGNVGDVALLYENGQWGVVLTVAVKTGADNHRAVYPISGKVSSSKLVESSYTPRMNGGWKAETRFCGAMIVGAYVDASLFWPFSLYNAVKQK